MAVTFKSVQLSATAIAPNLPTDVFGRERIDYFKYTQVGTEAATDIIELAKVPLGARIHKLTIFCADLGTTETLNIGDKDLATRYGTGLAGGTTDVFDYG